MRSLLIIGAGGYGKLVEEIAELNGFERIDFLDDNSPLAIGSVSQLEEIQDDYDGCVVAIGNPEIRQEISKKCRKLATLTHPSAVISKTAKVGYGCVIEANAVINTAAEVKGGTFICAGAVVNHNAVVGEFCQIDCNAVVAAGEKVPPYTKLESCTVYKKIAVA